MEYQVTLRIVLLNPSNGVLYCLEDDNERFVSTTMSTGDDIVFEFQAVVKPSQRTKKPNFTGSFARGIPSKRFFYINIGQPAAAGTDMQAQAPAISQNILSLLR